MNDVRLAKATKPSYEPFGSKENQAWPPCQRRFVAVAWWLICKNLISERPTDVLVLSRKVGERILIGDKIYVTVVRVGHGGVRIGIEAPAEMAVVREELAREFERTERELVAGEAGAVAD